MNRMVEFIDELLAEIASLPRDPHREALGALLRTLRPLVASLAEKAGA